jgi:DNA modification methylase
MTQLNKIHHDDWMNNGLPDKSVQLIIADPPYFEVKGDFDFVWESFDEYLKDVEKWAIECRRVLAENGTLFWWGHAKKIAYTQIILDKYFNLENSLVWVKTDCKPLKNDPNSMRTFAPVTERLLMYSKENNSYESAENKYNFIIGNKRTQIMEPLVGYMIDEMTRAGYSCKKIDELTKTQMSTHWFARTSQWSLPTENWYNRLRGIFGEGFLVRPHEELRKEYEELRKEYEELRRPFNNRGKLQTDVLVFSQESHITKNFDHETKKPETLTRSLILTCSRKGDTVLVPFAGSGTECAMSAREGRNFIGYEIHEKHANNARKRAMAELSRPSLGL